MVFFREHSVGNPLTSNYFSPITLTDVPESKKGMLKADLVTSVCAYGIYPDIHNLQKCATGIRNASDAKLELFLS